jgi:cytidine deaminase
MDEWISTQEVTRWRDLSQLTVEDEGKKISDKLREFVDKFLNGHFKVDQMFHRLCGRVVIAILETNTGEFFEGINTEMSIVTGSICAERAAIVHARSKNPSFKITDLKAVACITIPEDSTDRNPLWPCGVCSEWLTKIQAKNPNFTMYAYSSVKMEQIVERRAASVASSFARSKSNIINTPFLELDGPDRILSDSPSNLKASYTKILEFFEDSEIKSGRDVKKLLPWVRQWWLQDLCDRQYLTEISENNFQITKLGADTLKRIR